MKKWNISIKFFLALSFFSSMAATGKSENLAINEEKQFNQEVDGFLKITVLREQKDLSTLKPALLKAPFIWPIAQKLIKEITFCEKNKMEIQLTKCADVVSIHKGMIIAINAEEKYIWVQHVVQGGACYISILQDIDDISSTFKLGDIIQKGQKIGKSCCIIVKIIQPSNLLAKPDISTLFPSIQGVKITNKIDQKDQKNAESIENVEKKLNTFECTQVECKKDECAKVCDAGSASKCDTAKCDTSKCPIKCPAKFSQIKKYKNKYQR